MCMAWGLFRMVKGLFALMMMAVLAVVFIVVALVALIPLVVAAVAVLYLKREAWTLPAYRRARATSGRWGFTPWSPGDDEAAQA